MSPTMAQRSLRRPPIDVRPQHPRVLQLPGFAAHDAKARLAIGLESARMIDRVGVEGQARRTARQATLDGPIEQPRPDPPANELGRQPEKDDLVAVELEIADQRAVMARDMD